LRAYLIRLTREYTDGGMDSHADQIESTLQFPILYSRNQKQPTYFSSNARSAVRVFTGEAGEAFELFLAVFAVKLISRGNRHARGRDSSKRPHTRDTPTASPVQPSLAQR
jgi:hypothetical protein